MGKSKLKSSSIVDYVHDTVNERHHAQLCGVFFQLIDRHFLPKSVERIV